MFATIMLILCIFLAAWNTIIIFARLVNKNDIQAGNLLIWALSITGIITHSIGLW